MESVQDSDSVEGQLALEIAQSPPGQALDAEAALYRRLAPRVKRYGLRHLRDPHAAADLMQQVLTQTLEHLRSGRVREPQRVVSYVLGTCRLTVMDQGRTERRREALLNRHAAERDETVDERSPALDHRRVSDCMEHLSERERSVIVLSFYDEQNAEAVGSQLGLSAGNVRVIRHRSIDKLRRCVQSARGGA